MRLTAIAVVIAAHSASKTRVNALMTRQSIVFAKSSYEEDGPPEIGFTRFRAFKCASRINPTCVVKPAGDRNLAWRATALTRLAPSALATSPRYSASLRAFTPVFDGLWTRVNALMAGRGSRTACAALLFLKVP